MTFASKVGFMCTLLTPTHDQSLGSGDVRCSVTQLFCCYAGCVWNKDSRRSVAYVPAASFMGMIWTVTFIMWSLNRWLGLNLITYPFHKGADFEENHGVKYSCDPISCWMCQCAVWTAVAVLLLFSWNRSRNTSFFQSKNEVDDSVSKKEEIVFTLDIMSLLQGTYRHNKEQVMHSRFWYLIAFKVTDMIKWIVSPFS